MRQIIIVVPIFFAVFFFCPVSTASALVVEGGTRCRCGELDISEIVTSDPHRASRLKVVRRLRLLAQAMLFGTVTQRVRSATNGLRNDIRSGRSPSRGREELAARLVVARDVIDWLAMEGFGPERRVYTGCPSGCYSISGMTSSISSAVTRVNNIESSSSFISSSTTISSPGAYCLADNITSSSGTVITITSSGVTLDLTGHTISVSGQVGIDVQADGVTVKNGKIEGCSTGVQIDAAVSGVELRDLDIRNCTSYGVWLKGLTNGLLSRVHCSATTGDGIVVTTDNGVRGFSNVEVSNSKSQFASSDGDGFLFDLRTNSGAVTGGPLVVLNSIAFENAGNGFDVTQDANSGHVVLKGNSAQRHSGTGDDGFVATDTGVGIAVVNCYASENTNDYTIATTNNDFHEEATTTAGNWQFWECFSPGLAASP